MSTVDAYLGLRALVDELVRCGVRHACTSPGSRSTPVVLTLADDPRLTSTSHLDERSAGFFALGLAKATGRPVVLACTSGTAVANLMPAVIEASEARVPLIIITSDRPPELRGNGAGQTIDQVKLFGDAVRWYAEIDAAPLTPGRARWLRQVGCRAVWSSLEDRPGPVHLNVSLREPLVLDGPLPDHEPGGGGRPDGRPWTARPRTARVLDGATLDRLTELVRERPRAVLVAGRQERDPGLAATLARVSERLAIPLLADPLSGARRGPAAIAHYEGLVGTAAWIGTRDPELVLRVGDLPTCKPLRRWLHELGPDTEQVAFDPEGAWQDPGAVVGTMLHCEPGPALSAVADRIGERPAAGWLADWHRADRATAGAIAEVLGSEDGLVEPRIAAELGVRLPDEATLLVGASMPIRDAESFFPARPAPPLVLANRGANGIDGTASTAFGIAAAHPERPTVLLCGDVTLLHDLGGLLAARRTGARLTIVAIDNDGGGIFHFLPVAAAGGEAFERHVATPHGLDLAQVAALFDLDHRPVTTPQGLRDALDAGLSSSRTTLITVRTERERNVTVHRRVWAAVSAALATLTPPAA